METRINAFISYMSSTTCGEDDIFTITNILPRHITGFMSYQKNVRNNSSATIECHFRAVKAFFEYLIKVEKIVSADNNPCETIKPPKIISKSLVTLSVSEVEEMTTHVVNMKPSHNNLMMGKLFELLLTTALRIDEALSLRANNYYPSTTEDKSSYIEFIGKGNKLGRVYLNDKAERIIGELVKLSSGSDNGKEHLLFYNSAFNKFDYSYVNKWFKKLFVDMGRDDMTIHCLRATVATILCKKVGLVVASKVLRHSSTSTTQRYVTVDEDEKVSAMNLLNLL